jgi:hypothetical protein
MSKTKNVGGRPPVPGDKRDRLTQFYLTQVDYDRLQKFASEGGFRGISTLLTALIEPVVQGGLSIAAAARAINRLQKYMQANGAEFHTSPAHILHTARDLFAPPPPISEDIEDLSRLKQDLRNLLDELEKQTQPKTKKPALTQ